MASLFFLKGRLVTFFVSMLLFFLSQLRNYLSLILGVLNILFKQSNSTEKAGHSLVLAVIYVRREYAIMCEMKTFKALLYSLDERSYCSELIRGKI